MTWMIDLTDPTLNRKKKQKLIRLAYETINEEVKDIAPYIKSSSPLSKYWDTPEEEIDKSLLNDFRTTEQRYTEFPTSYSPTGKVDITKFIVDKTEKWENDYVKRMTELIVADKANSRGIPKAFERLIDAADDTLFSIRCVNIECRRKWIERCIEEEFFTPVTLTRLKLGCYALTDALKTDEVTILSEVCIDSDVETLVELIDEELETNDFAFVNEETEDISKQFNRKELEELKERIQLGEPFYVYRGFLVDEDEYVRKVIDYNLI